jgi:hypothetical protein
LTWNGACQIIVIKIQLICRMEKMRSKHESTMKNTHDNTIITTSNKTTLDSHKFDIMAIWLGIVPIKLLLKRFNQAVEWKMTSKHESTMKNTWQHNHYNKPSNNTRLTQIGHQGNLCWHRAYQTIAGKNQWICRMKNDKQAWEYNEKHMTTQSLQHAINQH